MKKVCFGFWLLSFHLLLIIPAQAETQYGRDQKSDERHSGIQIGSIRTAGNRSVSSAEVLSRVRSRAGQLFDPAMATEDAKRVAELQGVENSYYNTAVVDGKIQLTFVVVERNIVRSIVFVGNHKYKAKTLQKKVDLKVADYLGPVLAEAGGKSIAEFYRSKGFAFVNVTLDTGKFNLGELVYIINEGPRVKIASVRVRGNSAISTRELKKVIKTRTRKWFIWPRYYVEENVNKDVTKLQDIYQQKGFLDSNITARKDFAEDRSKIYITFAIDEGAVYTVGNITIAGMTHFDWGQLLPKLKLQEGQIYSELKADSDVKQLLKLYREEGFVDAKVEQRREFISEEKVNVEFEITEGQRFRIGQIAIAGNEQTQDKVIRRVLDEYDFQPGDWYNADIACGDGTGKLEKMVRSMTLAESATITPGGKADSQKDAQVGIIEGQTGSIMLGAGVASDSGVIGQLVFEQRNFDISDTPKSFSDLITGKAFRGAGQQLRIALQPGTEVSEYSISFTEPYFKNKPISLDVIGSSYERERESYDEKRLRGYLGFEKRYKDRCRRSVSFRLENVGVESLDSDAPNEIRDVKGDNLIAGVKLGIGRDLTDDRYNPNSGNSFDISYEQVGGDHSFGIILGSYRHYKTIYEDLAERKTVLSTKLLAGTVVGDAPPFEKFYAGGSGTYGIRGFDYRGVSTRGLNPVSYKLDDPIGSDWIFLANAEVAVPLVSDNFAALFFVDSGAIDSGNYRAAVGVGIQISIPQWFGPVPMRFAIATPLMKDDDDETQVFSFSVGRLF